MADVSLNTNVNNAITSSYSQKSDIQRTVAVGVGPEDASKFNATVMSGRTAVRPVNNNESRANNARTADKEASNPEANPNKNNSERPNKSIQLEFDRVTGYPVIKFRDTKGNVVSQVPPEQFLKMRSVLGYNRNKEEILEINNGLYSRKVGMNETEQNTSADTKGRGSLARENNLSLYV